eukprot:gene12544-8596_t
MPLCKYIHPTTEHKKQQQRELQTEPMKRKKKSKIVVRRCFAQGSRREIPHSSPYTSIKYILQVK